MLIGFWIAGFSFIIWLKCIYSLPFEEVTGYIWLKSQVIYYTVKINTTIITGKFIAYNYSSPIPEKNLQYIGKILIENTQLYI